MGTRSLTHVYEMRNSKPVQLINMYRQMDGYPSGHGKDLYEFLKDGELVNGIGLSDTGKIFNGAGCLAAQLVAHFKDGVGSFYLLPQRDKDCGQEWEYRIYVYKPGSKVPIVVKVYEAWTAEPALKFAGSVEAFGEWLEAAE